MKIANTKAKKALIIVIVSISLIVVVAIVLISPIVKYLVEKYDFKYTGRQIKTGVVYVNPFTGYVYISNLKIYEQAIPAVPGSGNHVFFSANAVTANFAMLKLLSKTLEISKLTIDRPIGTITQHKKLVNFSDLIQRFSSTTPNKKPSALRVNILGIKITSGQFYYREDIIPINYFIKEVDIESSGKHWYTDTIAVKFSLASGPATGKANGNITINLKSLNYRLALVVQKFDLVIIDQYLNDLTNYGHLSANLDAVMNSSGNFTNAELVTNQGLLVINDFHFGEKPGNDYASFKKLAIAIKEISPKRRLYIYDSISLSQPYFKYERYDSLDNLQRMFGKKGANIAEVKANPARFNLILKIADYVKALGKNFFRSNYKINRLAIYAGDLEFNDYSLSEKFSIGANPLYIIADSVNKLHQRVELKINSGIKPYGSMRVLISVNPKDSSDFDIKYSIQKLPVSIFNPYLITYTSFPVDRGTIELDGNWSARNGIIKSDNHLLVIDPRIASRHRNNNTKLLPTRLLMFFVRERGNVIDYQIPITGNLKDPRFHFRDIIFDVLGNIFVKPASTPYLSQLKTIENAIEKSLTLKWEVQQQTMVRKQEKFINKIVDFLKDNPTETIDVYPIQYAEKEMEYICFFEAKKKYYRNANGKNAEAFGTDDSLAVDKMSVRDPLFVFYINKQVTDTLMFTLQEKCKKYVGNELINKKFEQLTRQRANSFIKSFTQAAIEKQVKIHASVNSVPYNGYSFYRIDYNGELPGYLVKANKQLNDLNDISPRKRFEKVRAKISGIE